MSLFDFFFPEQAQAMHLRDIAEQGAIHESRQRRPWLDPAQRVVMEHTRRLEYAEEDIGTVALVCESLIRLGERKGLFTREELFAVMKEVDAEDGRKDGRMAASRISEPE
jgi:hypothetical protein